MSTYHVVIDAGNRKVRAFNSDDVDEIMERIRRIMEEIEPNAFISVNIYRGVTGK
jgi:hypothetical protein